MNALDFLSPGFQQPLLGCFGNPMECLFTWCCAGAVLASSRTHVDGRECGILDCCCTASPFHVRAAVRAKNGVEPNKVMDCLAICLCPACSIWQAAKEGGAPIIPEKAAFTRL
ncbi:hypothetical protein PTSG_08733 [Salpingoeca rosetta]|uniref:Uncharacterized protein n=1 Tax=Salpingoeca rosetta (strain ATCC 50818 / BSB-021) TaxID=946362 RepID=F2UKJ3_SALR5|nr:uncharacterized protein PTSG_08733 [Salpingoeca rosetta]EGD77642.1 hypothetical protein PTSG_08733 [Salpingoeca rosetta]|eukprot:XP_004990118.1 hypothetical protein PTSG_08733 [Salpingoeca rosetta]